MKKDYSYLLDALYKLQAPLCSCGCGGTLIVPRGRVLSSAWKPEQLYKYWEENCYIKGHRNRKASSSLSKSELGVVYGTLLGDACLFKRKQTHLPELSFSHSTSQKSLVDLKIGRLQSLNPRVYYKKGSGFNPEGQYIQVCTGRHNQLEEVYATVQLSTGRKVVNCNWLNAITPEGIAIWYLDDGCLSWNGTSPYIRIATNGFSLSENNLLATWLSDIGFDCIVRTDRRKEKLSYFLSLGAVATRKWLEEFKHFCPTEMLYKFSK